MAHATLSQVRQDSLRENLPDASDHLKANRASAIGDDAINDYVTLSWLEWDGGALKLTTIGRNICNQLLAGARGAAASRA